MSDYFMLECFAPLEGNFTDIREYPLLEGIDSWQTGARFAAAVPEPIRLEWDPETSGPRKTLYGVTIPLFHKKLVEALQESGCDNLDAYRAEIRDTRAGTVTTDFLAVNVIGAIAAADLTQSKYTAHSSRALIDVDFDALVVDPEKTRGALLFRLAECVTGLVVHRKVKEHLETQGGFGLTFLPPEEWIG